MNPWRNFLIGTVFALPILFQGSANAQDGDEVEIKVQHLRGNLYALFGQGGNLGMSAGDQGVFLIDDQFAPLTAKILAAIRTVSDQPVIYVLNTHFHGDHTGGNENLGEDGVLIISHDNVRRRLTGELQRIGRETTPAPAAALPVITFNDQASIFINGEEARATHYANAHTDGDSVIVFADVNVIHMGDIFFSNMYPYIDLSSGGSVDGLIAAVEDVLANVDDDTILIPGHGPIGAKADLEAYLAMLTTVRGRIKDMMAAGATLEEVVVAAPSAEYDTEWASGFMPGDRFVTTIYNSLED